MRYKMGAANNSLVLQRTRMPQAQVYDACVQGKAVLYLLSSVLVLP